MDPRLSRLARWPLQILREVGETYRLAARLPAAAPFIFALVAVPEFVQHVAEIRLGMFALGDSLTPGRETDIRMAFGITKIVALCLAILLTLRFWSCGGELRKAMLPSLAQTGRVMRVLGLVLLLGLPDLVLNEGARRIYDIFSAIVMTFALLWIIAVVAGADASLARSARATLPNLPRMIILPVAAWMPLTWLHGSLHLAARHQAEWLVWCLMTIDALVVGFLAAATGAALFLLVRCAGFLTTDAEPATSSR